MGLHANDCLGNVTLCPDGVTVSFWIYVFSQSHSWPFLFHGTSIDILAYTPSTNPRADGVVFNGTHSWTSGDRLIYDYWHHYALVYTAKDGVTWYSDGYRRDPETPKLQDRRSWNLELGCANSKNCAKAKYDDLRVWNEAKDENFIWHLWQAL